MPADIVEEQGLCSNCGPAELVTSLAQRKAAVIARKLAATKCEPTIVIGCDTVAECGGQILGKPVDEADARRILTALSDRRHRVYSGLCVWPIPDGLPLVRCDVTTLQMQPLAPEQLDAYLATHLWEGKAGAFGYQDGLDWVRIEEGSESNVVGLPLELLAEMLAQATG